MKLGFEGQCVVTRKMIYSPDDMRELVEPVIAWHDGQRIEVAAGYRTDGASIPRAAWRVIGHPWAHYLPAAIVHDVLYEAELVERKRADVIFRDLMGALGIAAWRRRVMYRAVRLFGGATWDKHTPASIEAARGYVNMQKR